MKRTTAIISFVALLLSSCKLFDSTNKELKELMSSVDAIEIKCYLNNDSASLIVTKKDQLDIFREIITGKNEDISAGEVIGRILYFRGKVEVLRVDNTTKGIEYHYKSITYKSRINYRPGMFVSEGCSDLMNKKN